MKIIFKFFQPTYDYLKLKRACSFCFGVNISESFFICFWAKVESISIKCLYTCKYLAPQFF